MRTGGRMDGSFGAMMSAHDHHRTMRVRDDSSRNRSEEPPLENAVSAMAKNNQVHIVALGFAHNLLSGVSSPDFEMWVLSEMRCLALQCSKLAIEMFAGILDDCFGLNVLRELRRPPHRQDVNFRLIFLRHVK